MEITIQICQNSLSVLLHCKVCHSSLGVWQHLCAWDYQRWHWTSDQYLHGYALHEERKAAPEIRRFCIKKRRKKKSYHHPRIKGPTNFLQLWYTALSNLINLFFNIVIRGAMIQQYINCIDHECPWYMYHIVMCILIHGMIK